ncbi:MAG: hypothetical protein DME60_09775 [Verrucomicrobia bacterium]|nr:MAG: hypothetical protein DME60_09775 [Verrucomicrobiota bacterium]
MSARGSRALGSARVSRAGFGVAPKLSFLEITFPLRAETEEKFAMARTPLPACETGALPGRAFDVRFSTFTLQFT